MVGVFRKDHLNHICCYDSILHKRIRGSCLVQTTAQQTYRREAAYTYSCDGYCGADVWILDRTFLHGVISWRYADISSLEQLQSYRHTLNKCTDAQMKGCRRRRWSEQRCSLNIVKKSRLKMETEKNQDQSKERNTNQSKNKSSAKSMLTKHRHRVSKKPHGHNSLMGTWAPVAECS